MNKHEIKNCPRCNSEFECKVGSVLLCHCSSVTLSEEQVKYLRSRYDDCLCHDCLLQVRKEFNLQKHRQKLGKFMHF